MRRTIAAGALVALAGPLGAQRRDSLPDSTFVLRPIVATATRNEIRPAEVPLAASALIPSPALRAEARVAVDLLRDLPGVHVQQTSAGQGAVVLRGLVGNQVLYLVDGIPLNNGTYRDGPGQYLATVDPETVERAEVVRGPSSVLYGSDAQGGVVNLITRPHVVDALGWSVRGTLHANSANRGTRARLSAGYQSPQLTVGMGGSFQQAGDLRAGGGLGPQRPTNFDAEGFDGRLTWVPATAHLVTMSAEHYAMHGVPRYDRYVTFRAPVPGRDADHHFEPQTRQLVYARHRWDARSRWLARIETTVSLAIQREGRVTQGLAAPGRPELSIERTRDDVFTPGVAVVAHSVPWITGREVVLTWGSEVYRDRLASSGTVQDLVSGLSQPITRVTAAGAESAGRFPDKGTMLRAGSFVSGEVALVQGLRASGGARWSTFRTEADVGTAFGGHVVNNATAVTGQFGLTAHPIGPVTLVARVAGGFRAPNLYDLTNVGSVPGGLVVPNPTARPEQSLGVETGARWDGPTTAFDVVVWHMTITDFIDRAPGIFHGDTLFRGDRVLQGINVAEARLKGLEIEVAQRIGTVLFRLSAQATRGDQTTAAGSESPMARIPPVSGSVAATWRTGGGRLTLTSRVRWARSQTRLHPRDQSDPRIPPGGTPGYVVGGLQATWVINRTVVIAGGLDNLTDRLYRTHGSGVDGPGRSLWVGLTFTDARLPQQD